MLITGGTKMTDTSSMPSSLLDLVTEPPMSPQARIASAVAGFALVVGLVLLAAFLGYRGSNQIQDTAGELVRENLIHSERGAELQGLIIDETQDLIDRLSWVLGVCFLLAAGSAGLTLKIIQRAFARLEWQSAELARVSWHMLDGHEKMAQRFSHEMHDEPGSEPKRIAAYVDARFERGLRDDALRLCGRGR
ncbi:MAG: hypothetical protein WDO18_05685 [Acidobacteriota bacterium]